ncbi:hypothetical protein IQ06DRAFT_116231 [Phaeosphaeriaceae sp. SRC1lsM3a]|nr:hypothetical protein IQ06DRAFT_116231 [Stagonospora sp. SRC1lsM3a]
MRLVAEIATNAWRFIHASPIGVPVSVRMTILRETLPGLPLSFFHDSAAASVPSPRSCSFQIKAAQHHGEHFFFQQRFVLQLVRPASLVPRSKTIRYIIPCKPISLALINQLWCRRHRQHARRYKTTYPASDTIGDEHGSVRKQRCLWHLDFPEKRDQVFRRRHISTKSVLYVRYTPSAPRSLMQNERNNKYKKGCVDEDRYQRITREGPNGHRRITEA